MTTEQKIDQIIKTLEIFMLPKVSDPDAAKLFEDLKGRQMIFKMTAPKLMTITEEMITLNFTGVGSGIANMVKGSYVKKFFMSKKYVEEAAQLLETDLVYEQLLEIHHNQELMDQRHQRNADIGQHFLQLFGGGSTLHSITSFCDFCECKLDPQVPFIKTCSCGKKFDGCPDHDYCSVGCQDENDLAEKLKNKIDF